MMPACRSEWGADVARYPGRLRNPVHIATIDWLPRDRSQPNGPVVRWPRQASSARKTGTVTSIVAGLLPLPTRCNTRYPRSVSA